MRRGRRRNQATRVGSHAQAARLSYPQSSRRVSSAWGHALAARTCTRPWLSLSSSATPLFSCSPGSPCTCSVQHTARCTAHGAPCVAVCALAACRGRLGNCKQSGASSCLSHTIPLSNATAAIHCRFAVLFSVCHILLSTNQFYSRHSRTCSGRTFLHTV